MNPTKENILDLFLQIEVHDNIRKIAFYEERFPIIFQLEENRQNYFKFEFVQSLFNLGRYEKVLLEIDSLIEYVFLEGINYVEKTYEHLIFIKAASHFGLHDYTKAVSISEQLVYINSHDELHKKLLLNCYYERSKNRTATFRLSSIFLILLSAATCLIFILKKESSIFSEAFKLSMSINIFVIVSITVILFYNQLRAYRDLSKYLGAVRTKKKKSVKVDV
jgi:hypothetical protein